MKLYVDDERPAPDDGWRVARTVAEATEALLGDEFEVVSLDYTLTRGETGEDVLAVMRDHNRWPRVLRLHSGSFSGQQLLTAIAQDYGTPSDIQYA